MPAKRKKWKVTYSGSGGDAVENFPSEKKTYEHIRELASLYSSGTTILDPRVFVWVHEGDSRGWQLYDDPDLSEWT